VDNLRAAVHELHAAVVLLADKLENTIDALNEIVRELDRVKSSSIGV
jgi:hypothetical protein